MNALGIFHFACPCARVCCSLPGTVTIVKNLDNMILRNLSLHLTFYYDTIDVVVAQISSGRLLATIVVAETTLSSPAAASSNVRIAPLAEPTTDLADCDPDRISSS